MLKPLLRNLAVLVKQVAQRPRSLTWVQFAKVNLPPKTLCSLSPTPMMLHMDRVKRIWYLSPMRAAKVQASLRIRAVSPEPPLLAHTSSESRGTFRQKARSLAPLNGWACAIKIYHDGMLEDTNSLDGAHIKLDQDWPTGFRDIKVQKCEIFVTQGQVTPKWVGWFGPKSNSTELLCLSWLPATLMMIRSKMNELAWRHHFPIISLWEIF